MLRQSMRLQRQQFFSTFDKDFVIHQLQQHFFDLNILSSNSVIGGYWPCESEVPILPLIQTLYHRGNMIGLPKVIAADKPLEFRAWNPDSPLVRDLKGIPCPNNQQILLSPTILLVPLLAFDERGGRLGQGGGFYDGTIRFLRRNQPFVAVGIAFEIQKVADVPKDDFDETLDYILSEEKIYTMR